METSNSNILATGRIGKLILKLALWVAQIFPRALIGIFGAANESVYYTGLPSALSAFTSPCRYWRA